MFDLNDHKIGHWKPDEKIEHIYLHTPSGKYVFSDETEQFNGPYDTRDEAIQAMNDYAKTL